MALEILDTTLRDGAQNTGVNYSLQDKIDVIAALNDLKITFIEAGAPGFNPIDKELFEKASGSSVSKLVAFGSTRRKAHASENDKALCDLVNCNAEYVSIVGKVSPFHVAEVLGVTKSTNRIMIAESVAYATKYDKKVLFYAEHFFDACRTDAPYAFSCIAHAIEAGATRIILCDTNGAALPEEVFSATKKVVKRFGQFATIGIHAHNDNGLAVANTLAAVNAGATHVQGTLLGIGERCGNASLATLIPLLSLVKGIQLSPEPELTKLTHVAYTVAEAGNLSVPDNMPYIGASAFAHKAGQHADGVLKTPYAFEGISPLAVGNDRRLVLSESAGKHLVYAKLTPYFPSLQKDSSVLGRVISKMKAMSVEGYTFEGAEGSFALMADVIIRGSEKPFEITDYTTTTSKGGVCTATVKVTSNGKENTATANGVGPVHALDLALRESLVKFFPLLTNVFLADYKVRVLNPKSATGATVRVLITTSDGGNFWNTVGVSPDIIEASITALADSYKFPLIFQNKIKDN